MLRTALVAFFSAASLQAQDGGQLFSLYCAACHGADGKGATGGQFPPLAGSDWVHGNAARAVEIVLRGLHGEIHVDGRTFNLEMPPQGAVLADDQIAAILTHVRSSWGNKAEPVKSETVKAIRAAGNDRKVPWTAKELLAIHPLPASEPPIANLTSQIYHGTWKDLPDFSQLEATNVEEEHDGLISVTHADRTDEFGLVWQGDLVAPESGTFVFRLDADDAARVMIDGKTVTEVRGTGPMNGSRAKQGKINLTAGPHKIRIEFVEFFGQESIALAWKGPGLPSWRNLADHPIEAAKPSIPIQPSGERAVVYRNFIADTTPRAIGIGFPGGLNLAYSADHLAPELIWSGYFMDGSRHWVDRGQGNQPPAGENVVKLSGTPALPSEARFRGYKLDPSGNPTFMVQIGDQTLQDAWKPGITGGKPGLVRSVTAGNGKNPLEILISDRLPMKQTGDLEFDLGSEIQLHVEQALVESRDGKSFLKLAPGQTAVLTYRWK
ncbi:PA14 domain-containing protein [Luteolibacter marinus]|uniref:PA14 domain-containing protein n=1 Tax=Luteolibacter marinus TaxID=2776705 RepID=UPI001865A92D|nr:PA14 domain-containing protein [Luteolibacter marinus]